MSLSTVLPNLQSSDSVLSKLDHTFLNLHSLLILLVCVIVGLIFGNIAAQFVQKLSLMFGHRADKATNLSTVTFMRRIETILVMSIAIVRLTIVIIGLYVWWILTHAGEQPSALIGASALALVIAYGLSGPLLRDVAFGSGMMAEQWFGVGDIVTMQPNNIHGVVERITLRSTKVRGFSGEIIWFSNQNINMVSVVRKGTWAIALELFVYDTKAAERLIERTNKLLPTGTSLVISPLTLVSTEDRGEGISRMTFVGETAPGRDYLLRENAISIMNKLNQAEQKEVLLADIVARFADKNADKQIARAISNARKTRRPKKTTSVIKNRNKK